MEVSFLCIILRFKNKFLLYIIVKTPNKWRRLKKTSIPSRNLPGMPTEVPENTDISVAVGESSCDIQIDEEMPTEQEEVENVRHFTEIKFPIATEMFQFYQEHVESQQTQIQFLHRFIEYQKSLIDEKDIEIKKLKEEFNGQNEKKNKIIIRCEHELNNIKKQVGCDFTLYLILNNLYCSFLFS